MNGQQNNPNGRKKPRDNGKLPPAKAIPPARRRRGPTEIPPDEIGVEPLPKR